VNSIKVGDLVKMKTHDTGLVGLVIDRDHHPNSTQIAIKWCGGSDRDQVKPDIHLTTFTLTERRLGVIFIG